MLLVLCNSSGKKYLINYYVGMPLSTSCHHSSIHFSLRWESSVSTLENFCHCFKKADYNVIHHKLTLTNWTKIIHSSKNNVQVLYNKIIHYLKLKIDAYVPYQAYTYKPQKNPSVSYLKRKISAMSKT